MAYNLNPESLPAVRGKLDPPSAAGPAPSNLDRQATDSVVQAVTAAVESYLAQRGANPGGWPAAAPPSRPAVHDVVAGAVERYLEQRAPRPSAPVCGCGLQPPATAAPPSPAAPAKVEPPAPPVVIVDFVCESDVRAALAHGKKIFIGPRTIVTPSARELAAPGEILVRAQR
jgi:hypothetical protein